MLIQYGLKAIGALVILLLGIWISRIAGKRTKKYLFSLDRIDNTLVPVVSNVVRISIMIVTLLAVLNQFGVQTTSFVAILGAAGLAIGLALQGTLSNVASGVMLLIFRPFKVGEVVRVNNTVCMAEELGLFICKFKTFDNISIYLPNSSVWGSEIHNLTENPTRRTDIIIGISYSDDINKAYAACKDELQKEERVLKDQDILVAVDSLGDSSVNILVRYWTLTPNAVPTKLDMTKKLKERFDAENISIPFPQRDVHLFQAKN
jgi:small conductance mechanosensitive channel